MPPKNVPAAKTAAVPVKLSTSKTKAAAAAGTATSKTGPANVKKGGAASAPVKAPKTESKEVKPVAKEWTPLDDAARKIQTKIRQFLAKKALVRKRKEKEEYETQMDKLEKEAFLQLVKMEQEEAERKRKKEEEERKLKQEENKRKKRMLEAAFDGDLNVLKQVMKEVTDQIEKNGIGTDVIGRAMRTKLLMAVIDCADANGNTPLSEAANGGHADIIKYLIDNGADPNSQGQILRTPIYRAAFSGHLSAVQTLLENGADPRIYASDNQRPNEIASTPAIKEVIDSWDITRTEDILKKLQAAKEKRTDEDRQRREAETNKLENVVAQAKKEYESKQKMLDHAYAELNKRITEHDMCVAQGFDRPDITLQSIHDQEFEVENIKLEVSQARDKLATARLRLRESQVGADEEAVDELPGLKVAVRELDEVLLRDTGGRIKESGKWPLLIDSSGQAATFLRYRDTNYIVALRQSDMKKNNVRICLLGAIRYGKPLVVDMMEVDMFDTCVDRFDEIIKGLMASIVDKSILQEEKYSKLIKESDGPEYDKMKFNDLRISNFKFILVTKNPFPDEKLMEKFYVIRVIT